MTQEQFYYCLNRIVELREKIMETYIVRRRAQAIESAQAEEQQVDFNALKVFAENKEDADRNTAEAQALLKELAAQEAKIRAFVPVSVYGTKIKATHLDGPDLYLVVEAHRIAIEKATL
ncbi:hypothetical protein [Pontibacter fetidus]|uniref:Uncharacterized protein n=1 Tax=Pontibacter fetidus TaxID=2700082 RepID=A0A6B2H924_9BACT|nr:hypothetical protein [Pontibacter fetidus]NDK55724.1 hypothetical protein [Pontibacter fetidus]